MRTALLLLTCLLLIPGSSNAASTGCRPAEMIAFTVADDDALQNMISVYLNPASGKFQLIIDDLEYCDLFELEVLNTQGEIVLSIPANKYQTSNEIDLTEHKKGLYFVTVSYRDKKQTEKIVVQ